MSSKYQRRGHESHARGLLNRLILIVKKPIAPDQMANQRDVDVPVALRRPPRRCVNATAAAEAEAPASAGHMSHQPPPHRIRAPTPVSAFPETPRKARSKKRVRFSDPGPAGDVSHDDGSLCSTGLTPMVKRSSLGEPSQKRRRAPASAMAATRRRPPQQQQQQNADSRNDDSMDDIDILSLPSSNDDRGKRRVRRERSRLNEEVASGRRRTSRSRTRKENEVVAAEVEAEIQRLRVRLADRDAEIARLNNETIIQDTERILQLEKQIETLRAELSRKQTPVSLSKKKFIDDDASDGSLEDELANKSFYNWSMSPRDPFSDSYMDADRDVTMADAACSTPSRRRRRADSTPAKSVKSASVSAFTSFPTPPSTSPIQPIQPVTPPSRRRAVIPATPQSHTGVQASLPDPEKEALEAELGSLRSELSKLTATVETHAAQQARLSEKLASALSQSTPDGEDTAKEKEEDLEANLDKILQTLSDRTTTLKELNTSLSTLGFAGENATEIVATMTANFRAARLELEYLTPGEIPLPLSSHGAEVLDLVLTQLRDLARKAREDEDAIEEYRKIELSLHQQLTAQVELADNESTIRERDERITELHSELKELKGVADGYKRDAAGLKTEIEALKSAADGYKTTAEGYKHAADGYKRDVDGYKRDVAALQTRVDEGAANNAKLETDLTAARDSLIQRDAVVTDLEGKLSGARAQADELGAKVKELQKRRDAEAKARNQTTGAALALRDARVAELRKEIDTVTESLRGAQETILKLKMENQTVAKRVELAEGESKAAREEVEKLRNEIETERAERAARKRRSAPGTPEPRPGSYLSAELARGGPSMSRSIASKPKPPVKVERSGRWYMKPDDREFGEA